MSSRSSEASLRHHMTHACKLMLGLVSSWPPLIVSKPTEFREDWHDREYQYWDKPSHKNSTSSSSSSRPPKLIYTRPVLFRSYQGAVGAKGWVGNRDREVGTTGPHPSPNHRASRKTRSGTVH